jgi:hypothetical protein
LKLSSVVFPLGKDANAMALVVEGSEDMSGGIWCLGVGERYGTTGKHTRR